jgi:hypothetical protein
VSAPAPGNGDLFYKGSVWRGTSSQERPRRTAPQETEIVVTRRDGEKFQAQLYWKGQHLRNIAGTIHDGEIRWRGVPGQPNPGLATKGRVDGRQMNVHYSGTVGVQDVEGATTLEYVSPRQN